MKQADFNSLPYGLLLEICMYLDVASLVALSQTNRAMKDLSASYKSYWLPSIIGDQLGLPLPSHLPPTSFTAPEIKDAVHKALHRENNLTSATPELFSYTHIRWPYEFPPTLAVEGPPNPLGEEPAEVVWMHLAHPNGQWELLVSENNVLRILNLKLGTLAWEEKFGQVPPNNRVAFAVDFRGDLDARIAMVIMESNLRYSSDEENEGIDEDYEEYPVILVHQVKFHPEKASLELELQVQRRLDKPAIYLDIAGDHVILLEQMDAGVPYAPDAGLVRVFHWPSNTFVGVEQLLPSVTVSAFQDYFFALGVQDSKTLVFQAVALPGGSGHLTDTPSITSQSDDTAAVDRYPVAASMQIPVLERGTDLFAMSEICHSYTGPTLNVVNLWLRETEIPGWTVIKLEADFRKPPLQWFSGYQKFNAEEESGEVKLEMQCNRVYDGPEASAWKLPTASGRRFVWHQQVAPEVRGPGEEPVQEAEVRQLVLYSALVSHTPVIDRASKDQLRLPSAEEIEGVGKPSQCMSVPDGFLIQVDDESVYTIALEEWSGTVVVILTSGDIWVLRYGHR